MLTIYKKDDTDFFQNINININTEQDLTGMATIATNNGLDILSHTQFLEEPTVEIVKDYNALTKSNLITKQHIETRG